MADKYQSQLSTTTTLTGSYFLIIIPDAGSPTGFTSYRIAYANLMALVTAAITGNTNSIDAILEDVTELQDLTGKDPHRNEVSNFVFSQPADSRITEIVIGGDQDGSSYQIGTTPLGTELYENTSIDEDEVHNLELNPSDMYSQSARTVYFTITGTISATIYYRKKEIFTT